MPDFREQFIQHLDATPLPPLGDDRTRLTWEFTETDLNYRANLADQSGAMLDRDACAVCADLVARMLARSDRTKLTQFAFESGAR